jgi:hypothetical protein
MFGTAGCPHCARARDFLAELARERPDLEIAHYDVDRDAGARERLRALSRSHGAAATAVPSFLVCDAFLVGFDGPEGSGARLRALVAGEARAGPQAVRVPLFGELDPHALGFPLFTLLLGLVDGLNPCAMWVLLFLLSILVNLRERWRIAAVAGTFVLVSGAAYLAFMAAWLEVFLWIGFSRALQVALGLVALAVGGIHLKDALALGGPSLAIPEAAKPGIYARVRRIVQAENLAGALAGAFVLAVLVNGVELLCTAGLPALYTQILALQELPPWRHYAYLVLYNAAYVFDDALLVALVVATLGRRKLRPEQGRWLQLLSGGVMFALGLVLLLRPDWLAT